MANVKGKSKLRFINSAKLMWAANRMPPFDDNTPASMNRLREVNCEKTIPKDSIKDFIYKDYITDQELSGLVNHAIEGLHRLDERGGFILPSIDERTEKHELATSALFIWAEENLNFTGWQIHKMYTETLHESYIKWCKEKDIKILPTLTGFVLDFKNSFHDDYLKHDNITIKGERKRGFTGVMFYDEKTEDILDSIDHDGYEDDFEDKFEDDWGDFTI